jgi:hypothetical protein
VRCRELDVFKILEIFWIFLDIFLEDFFGGILYMVLVKILSQWRRRRRKDKILDP